jgi:hypothetical protein
LYQINKTAELRGIPAKSAERTALADQFFFERGILTTAHLTASPIPEGLEWQVHVLNYIRKLETKLHRGHRPEQTEKFR